ncbi:outer membrane protein assembly factor BamE [Psychromonas antarctica]|jgi:outer membrane protein assembly factor BamE|uniref:outer membrane protein assembly factor BamE n=1 Tax=Psychromonas antarctica TaxID=67573 RepID=UPI001EE8D878|nr:outer membrane protein assembly factor BamE [Psychromonas antarctica]MCG6201539.1 outer membrane protein assembly factor BamE [Psychromonas antarctica]
MPIKNIITCFFLIFSLSGCSFLYDTFVYQIDITQGNYIDDKKLDQVELGMNQEQVIFILGSPMLIDQFNSSKWYYIRYIKPGGKDVQQQQAILTFNDKILTRIDREELIRENPLNNQKLRKAPNAAAESSEVSANPETDGAVTIEKLPASKKEPIKITK